MKCLSLWQPYASLVALGAKRYETRSYRFVYQGPLVIHAAKRTEDVDYWFNQPLFRAAFAKAGITHWLDLPFGAALCIVDFDMCVPTDHIRERLSVEERAFGNYESGRYALALRNVRRFATPVPMLGAQGLFNAPIALPLGELIYD